MRFIASKMYDRGMEKPEKRFRRGFPQNFFVNIKLSSRHFEGEDKIDYIVDKIEARSLPRGSIRIEVVGGPASEISTKHLWLLND